MKKIIMLSLFVCNFYHYIDAKPKNFNQGAIGKTFNQLCELADKKEALQKEYRALAKQALAIHNKNNRKLYEEILGSDAQTRKEFAKIIFKEIESEKENYKPHHHYVLSTKKATALSQQPCATNCIWYGPNKIDLINFTINTIEKSITLTPDASAHPTT